MNRSIPALLLAALALLFPVAAAETNSPPLPNVRECSTYQVDWANCEGYLLCVEADWGNVEKGACVVDPCPDFGCSMCADLECYLPGVYVCTYNGKLTPRCEGGELACVQAWWGDLSTVPICAERPVCPGPSWCYGPWVDECSEFQVDWNYCAGYLLCVQAGYQNVQTREFCVANPCTPRLAGCVSCDVDCVQLPYSECHQRIGTTSGSVGCTGILGPYDYYCLMTCPPSVTPVDCHQDTTGNAYCYVPRF